MMLYFDHDTSASTDPKIMQLRLECGGAAVDAYWYLVELMCHNEYATLNDISVRETNLMLHLLCVDEKTFNAWLEGMAAAGLFIQRSDGCFISPLATESLKKPHRQHPDGKPNVKTNRAMAKGRPSRRLRNNKREVLSKKHRFMILERDNFTCQYCGATAKKARLHVDHIKPVSKGGTNDPDNLITACEACNNGKRAHVLGEDRKW